MSTDRFFGASEDVPEGPVIVQDYEGIFGCYIHTPAYTATILGPVPFGAEPRNRIMLSIVSMHVPDLAEAEENCWNHVHSVCEQYNYPFDADEWDIVSLAPTPNCN